MCCSPSPRWPLTLPPWKSSCLCWSAPGWCWPAALRPPMGCSCGVCWQRRRPPSCKPPRPPGACSWRQGGRVAPSSPSCAVGTPCRGPWHSSYWRGRRRCGTSTARRKLPSGRRWAAWRRERARCRSGTPLPIPSSTCWTATCSRCPSGLRANCILVGRGWRGATATSRH